jgi:hypothetical protein
LEYCQMLKTWLPWESLIWHRTNSAFTESVHKNVGFRKNKMEQ